MSDYERYGDYNNDPDEQRGPARSRVTIVLAAFIGFLAFCLMFGTCGFLAYRMIASGYYPESMKTIHYTEALTSYATGREIYAETQGIRVPFADELILSGDDGQLVQSPSRFGFYYADNLILVRDGGSLQLSVRINKNDIENIAAEFGLTDFAFSPDAFSFRLYDNKNVSEDKALVGGDKDYKLDMGKGGVYTPTYVTTESHGMYHYVKLCFDGVDFRDVKWMRLDIIPQGADTNAEDYVQLGICVYENHEMSSQFKEYKLKKSEKLA